MVYAVSFFTVSFLPFRFLPFRFLPFRFLPFQLGADQAFRCGSLGDSREDAVDQLQIFFR